MHGKNLKQVNSSCIKIVLFGPNHQEKQHLQKSFQNITTVYGLKNSQRLSPKKWDKEKKACELSDIMVIAEVK